MIYIESTVYVGNLDERVNDALLWELMVQVAPVVHVHIPRDRISQQHQGYGFVELRSAEDAEYVSKVMNQVKLYGKPLKVNKATADKKTADVGANIFIGNLAPEVDEKVLTDTFSAFGTIIDAKVGRDLDTGAAKGFGFVNFDSFEASDAAIEAMNGQFLCNKPITITYALKKDGKGERHGSAAERLLALQARQAGISVAQAAAEKNANNPYAILQPGQAIPPPMYGQPPMAPYAMSPEMMMAQQQQAYPYPYPPQGYYQYPPPGYPMPPPPPPNQ
jgi:splicing factor 3B subunit 4